LGKPISTILASSRQDRHFDTSVVDPQSCAAGARAHDGARYSLKIERVLGPSVDHPIVMPNPVRAEAPADRTRSGFRDPSTLIADASSEYGDADVRRAGRVGQEDAAYHGDTGAATNGPGAPFQSRTAG